MDTQDKQTRKEIDLYHFFKNPETPRQRQYEAVRAIVVEGKSIEDVAKEFGYKISTLYSLLRDVKAKNIDIFPIIKKGPKKRQTSIELQQKIIKLRRMNFSSLDIQNHLGESNIKISAITIERILKDAGFNKLKRRTNIELGITSKSKIITDRSFQLDFNKLEPFNISCPTIAGYFFLPYILETRILDIIGTYQMPDLSDIGPTQASLSMLLLKLIGCKKLKLIRAYDREPGLGAFAGLNVLPKASNVNDYSSYSCTESQVTKFQSAIVSCFKQTYPNFYNSNYSDLDFQSLLNFGDESGVGKVWAGARGKTQEIADTVFAQDSQKNTILYTRADVIRSKETDLVKKFISYWKSIDSGVGETLVFDYKFSDYKTLNELNKIKFISLQKQYPRLTERILALPKKEWKKINIPISNQDYSDVFVHENEVNIKGYDNSFRRIAIKVKNKNKPVFIVSNDKELSLKKILELYAHRWHVEKELSELVTFFNLNALSSTIILRVHFDVLYTLIADTLYHRFTYDLRRFDANIVQTIVKKFVNMPGRVVYDGNKFIIQVRKNGYTPILKKIDKLQKPFRVPWLDSKLLEIVWMA